MKIVVNQAQLAVAKKLVAEDNKPMTLADITQASLALLAKSLEKSDGLSETSPQPWDNEPAYKMIEHAGYVCELKRHPAQGFWMGYVHAGENHPLCRVPPDDLDNYLDAHGGITHQNKGTFGFDCGHMDDLIPAFSGVNHVQAVYRTIDFVEGEVRKLAQQLRNYDTAYHRRSFDIAEQLEGRAEQIRRAMRKDKK